MRQAKLKKVTEEEKNKLCEMYKTMSLSKISRLSGYSVSAIREWIIEVAGQKYYESYMHSTHANRQSLTDQEMADKFVSGVPICEIAKEAKICGTTVRRKILTVVGLEVYRKHTRRKRTAKELEDYENEIWRLYMGYDEFGEWNEKNIHSRAELAARFGTSVNNIQDIINRVSVKRQAEAIAKYV